MVVLGILNIASAFLLSLWPLWFSRRFLHLPVLNPLTIVMALGLPVQLMTLYGGPVLLIPDGLFDKGYQYALLMGNLLVLSQLAGLVTFFFFATALRVERYLPFQHVELSRGDIRRALMFFICLFLAAFFLLANAQYGVANWIMNPREGYQFYRVGQGHWYALAISALAVTSLLLFLHKPTGRSLLLCAPMVFVLGYLLGSKNVLLTIFTSLLVFLWFIRWRHLTKMLLFGTPIVFVLMVWNLYLALSDSFEAESIVAYFDYYKNAADYYDAMLAGDITLFGGEVAMSSFWTYVPRALWPDKPFAYGITLVNEIFFPGAAEATHTPAFGGAVQQYADFGVAGVVFLGFFSPQFCATAILSYLTFKRPGVRFDRITLSTALLLLVLYAPSFGEFFPGTLYLVAVAMVVLVIGILRRRRIPYAPSQANAQ